ncbi:ROK family transcriptional regulator [Actinosynnema pretiosum subsp. pretiosum]|uniref:ROK family protein n=2 Tax=Actinosynnema TaxID=40566 RepID=C6WM93_ACTMD|nr:ROK family transcriptional regulator [Actinosynnema mirum]ACU34827.1 ROK family protein [Actinosynnema mirum DSM 43827]AXX28192.1 Xylose-responsive transcription regulator, ROK family [Actinosynnema pretiosum subsp. pretiosum]QUF07434.1 ROK family transcriptional regulator [Actinosynnema pretiosum subsp. pretiosum]
MQRKLTVRDLRAGNRARVLRTLYFDRPRSRQEIAGLTGLSQASVSTVVGELIGEGTVVEAGQVESDGGRPRVLLRVDPARGVVVGVDVGETHVLVEAFDLTLERLAGIELPAPRPLTPEAVAACVLRGVRRVLDDAGAPGPVLGVGVGVPGSVDGGVVHAQTVGWHGAPLERLLRAGLDVPLHLDNGANTLGQAEAWFGAGRGAPTVVVALIGSGVGASVVVAGAPYRGAFGGAGEWGHTTVALDGARCRCGANGCLEAYLGAGALVDRYRALAPDADGGDADEDQERAFRSLLAARTPEAERVLAEAVRYAGLGVGNLVNLLNPTRVVVGGWAGLLLGERFLAEIRAEAGTHALRRSFEQVEVVLGELGAESVALGAATLPVADFLASGGVAASAPPAGRAAAR